MGLESLSWFKYAFILRFRKREDTKFWAKLSYATGTVFTAFDGDCCLEIVAGITLGKS